MSDRVRRTYWKVRHLIGKGIWKLSNKLWWIGARVYPATIAEEKEKNDG